eukprot:TRINITY_DN7923_c0_g1_i4.p1 TRINITY_DN7923_c0_g1~~TRINITY_DN7923_c0_g1_i4.p1  ORF type:complete len:135 (+),score=40.13 TRINITY_DN7923_c0_g1_i4:62-406(+)
MKILFCFVLLVLFVLASSSVTMEHSNEQPSQDVLGLEHKPNSDAQQMDLGNSMKFDHLGPIIVNADGTMSRIANWDTLSPQEQATTFRLISARNAQRLKALREQEAQAKEATDS